MAGRSAGLGSRETAAPTLLAAGLLAIVVTFAYGVVLSATFGVADDYLFLQQAQAGSRHTLFLHIGAGRPLNGLLLDLAFRLAGTVEGFTALRGVTLVGIWLLGVGLYSFAARHRLGHASALAIACGTVLLPSFQVYAAWAQHCSTPLAGDGGAACRRAAEAPPRARAGRRRRCG